MSKCDNVQKVFVPSNEDKTDKKSISRLEITDLAAEKIKHFTKKDKKSAKEYGLYITVVSDGCSGKSYTMNLKPIKEAEENGDKIFEKNGATIMVQKTSYLFVIGSTLDYAETLLMSGFQINNPNVKKTCSCGSSFAV